MAIFALSTPGVYVEIVGNGGAGGNASGGGGNGACGSGFGANGAGGAGGCGSDGIGICGGGAVGAHAHCISDPGHHHGFGGGCAGDLGNTDKADNLAEFMRSMTQAIAQSMTMPPQVWEPCAKYLPCPNAFVVRDIDQRFSWQNE
jgi:hypothetical protein